MDTDYITEAITEFKTRYGINVDAKLYQGVQILEDINVANSTGTGPDVYMLPNDQTKKAAMAGLAKPNSLYTDEFWKTNYPKVAKDAVTTSDKAYGYPMYFDTYFIVYDSAIVETAPVTIQNILDFSNQYENVDGSKTIFKWNVVDPFYDYMYIGGYAEILGDTGEDTSVFSVNSENVIASMQYYQSLNEYLSMDATQSNYDDIKEEITNGSLIYGICKTDMLPLLEREDTTYKLAVLPNLTDTLASGTISITYSAVVNDYTDEDAAANLFASFLSYEYAEYQYRLDRRVSTRQTIERSSSNESVVFSQYITAKTAPKALESGDFWTYSEITFRNIWQGNDVATELNNLQTTMEDRLK